MEIVALAFSALSFGWEASVVRIVCGLRESMAVLLYGGPCVLTFWADGRLNRYEGYCYEGSAHFPGLDPSTGPSDYWIRPTKRAA